MKYWITLLLLLVPPALRGASPDYLNEVKPILVEHCYRCHGASQQKGGLRLDTADAAKKGGNTGPGWVSSKSAESLIVQAVKGLHPDIPRMPYKKPPLSTAQISVIEQWITAGAVHSTNEAPESARHWAFIPPGPPPLPKIAQTQRPKNQIDYFILERLENEKIKPSPQADR